MKLSDREIEIISEIPKNRRNRRRGVWLAAASALTVLVLNFYIDYDLGLVITMLGGFMLGQAATHHSARSEDKLIELVQRYVNSDPEAIRQFAMRAGTGEKAG